jgi:hypothetical protein
MSTSIMDSSSIKEVSYKEKIGQVLAVVHSLSTHCWILCTENYGFRSNPCPGFCRLLVAGALKILEDIHGPVNGEADTQLFTLVNIFFTPRIKCLFSLAITRVQVDGPSASSSWLLTMTMTHTAIGYNNYEWSDSKGNESHYQDKSIDADSMGDDEDEEPEQLISLISTQRLQKGKEKATFMSQ